MKRKRGLGAFSHDLFKRKMGNIMILCLLMYVYIKLALLLAIIFFQQAALIENDCMQNAFAKNNNAKRKDSSIDACKMIFFCLYEITMRKIAAKCTFTHFDGD